MGVSGPRRPTSAPCQRRCRPGPADATRTTGDQRGAAGCAGTAAAAGACRGWGDGGAGLAQRGLEEDKGVSEVGECGGVGGGLEKGIDLIFPPFRPLPKLFLLPRMPFPKAYILFCPSRLSSTAPSPPGSFSNYPGFGRDITRPCSTTPSLSVGSLIYVYLFDCGQSWPILEPRLTQHER